MAKEKMGAYKRKGAAESKYLSEDGDVIDQNKKTAGPAEIGGKKGDDSKSKKDYEGPGRSSGYTQNFGPARVSGYTKGAAKINSIMGKGPAEGFLNTVKKVGRTGLDIAKSVGAQALDLISPDPIRSDYFSMGDTRSASSSARNNKESEQNILDRVENRSASGSTYPIAGSVSRLFNDTGYGRNIFGGDEFGNYVRGAGGGKPGPTSSRTANSPGVFPGLEVNSPSGTGARDTSKGINSVEYDAKPISPGANKKK